MQTEGNVASKPCQPMTALIDERASERDVCQSLHTFPIAPMSPFLQLSKFCILDVLTEANLQAICTRALLLNEPRLRNKAQCLNSFLGAHFV